MATYQIKLINNANKILDTIFDRARKQIMKDLNALIRGITSELNTTFKGKPASKLVIDNIDGATKALPPYMDMFTSDIEEITSKDPSVLVKSITWDGKYRALDYDAYVDLLCTLSNGKTAAIELRYNVEFKLSDT